MLTIAYLANQFPSAVEPYVIEEIQELQKRGVRIVAGSVRKPATQSKEGPENYAPEIVLQPLGVTVLLQGLLFWVRGWKKILPLIWRIVFQGSERPVQRIKALMHTWLGACYAVRLAGRGVDHIHVHHGYFGSWVGMVAARLLGVGFSLTLHGSDLLLHGSYIDVKLRNCTFCLTISEYNRRYILQRHPTVDPEKIVVSRLGVEISAQVPFPLSTISERPLALLAVGRLHAVKDHAFLIRACAQLHQHNVNFECSIAGDGPERRRLESLLQKHGLKERVTLLGHVQREQMDSLYDRADIVVLTSRSEGIPLVLMEAMARGKIVLAPSITGIPELVIAGKTGFLYQAGEMDDFVAQILSVQSLVRAERRPDPVPTKLHPHVHTVAKQLEWVRHAARVQVRQNFNRKKNLESFGDLFIRRIAPQTESLPHEDFVLQQI